MMNDRLFPQPEIPCECGHMAMLCIVRVECFYLAYVCDKCGRGGNSARQSNGFPTLDSMYNALDGADFANYLKYDKVSDVAFCATWGMIKQRINKNIEWNNLPGIGDFI